MSDMFKKLPSGCTYVRGADGCLKVVPCDNGDPAYGYSSSCPTSVPQSADDSFSYLGRGGCAPLTEPSCVPVPARNLPPPLSEPSYGALNCGGSNSYNKCAPPPPESCGYTYAGRSGPPPPVSKSRPSNCDPCKKRTPTQTFDNSFSLPASYDNPVFSGSSQGTCPPRARSSSGSRQPCGPPIKTYEVNTPPSSCPTSTCPPKANTGPIRSYEVNTPPSGCSTGTCPPKNSYGPIRSYEVNTPPSSSATNPCPPKASTGPIRSYEVNTPPSGCSTGTCPPKNPYGPIRSYEVNTPPSCPPKASTGPIRSYEVNTPPSGCSTGTCPPKASTGPIRSYEVKTASSCPPPPSCPTGWVCRPTWTCSPATSTPLSPGSRGRSFSVPRDAKSYQFPSPLSSPPAMCYDPTYGGPQACYPSCDSGETVYNTRPSGNVPPSTDTSCKPCQQGDAFSSSSDQPSKRPVWKTPGSGSGASTIGEWY